MILQNLFSPKLEKSTYSLKNVNLMCNILLLDKKMLLIKTYREIHHLAKFNFHQISKESSIWQFAKISTRKN